MVKGRGRRECKDKGEEGGKNCKGENVEEEEGQRGGRKEKRREREGGKGFLFVSCLFGLWYADICISACSVSGCVGYCRSSTGLVRMIVLERAGVHTLL